MKVGIFSPYWQTFGGGERYLLSVAEFFQNRGDDVNVFWKGELGVLKIKQRFDIDLSKVKFIPDIFQGNTSLLAKLYQTSGFDLIFYISDGSIPTLFAKKNVLHFQVPFHFSNRLTLFDKLKLGKISKVVCNSHFTKKYIDETYEVNSVVIYPPVDVEKFHAGKKENVILSVGRFFGPSHPKKHEVLIEAFKILYRQIPTWRLVLVGGVFNDEQTIKLVQSLREKINEAPIEILTDTSFSSLQKQYSRARIYWHATGFGEDLEKFPEKAEHFGITTVEAMSAGVIPIVFAGGGQLEIIKENESGYLWKSTKELINKTNKIIKNEKLQSTISANAIRRAQKFSKERFFTQLDELTSQL